MEALKCESALFGVASRTMDGEKVCGDTHAFVPFAGGLVVAAIDGLGHGPEAAIACSAAAETISGCSDEGVIAVIQRCHERLHGTRGAVISIASLDAKKNEMTWLGVGNVEACLLRADVRAKERPYVLARGGVVGHSLPPLRAETLSIARGDTLIMATDGIHSGFCRDLDKDLLPQEMADSILERFGRNSDDALVAVVRWLGQSE